VKDERARIFDSSFDGSKNPLHMMNMKKIYTGRNGLGAMLAVNNVSFAVEKNTVFGLLGPNGIML
jgi:ABC-type multidrug transport system ATPase subunit